MFTVLFQPDMRFNPGSLRALAMAALPGSSRERPGVGAQPAHGADAHPDHLNATRAEEPGTCRERPVFVGESPPTKKSQGRNFITLFSYV